MAVAALVSGCGSGASGGGKAPDYEAALRGAPPKLEAIYEQGPVLLPGGADAFSKRLRELRGHPIVVNKWASWCGPCRHELPFFQSQVAERGKEVAFLAINSNDSDSAARRFLSEFPVPYPSYEDPKLEVAKVIDAPLAFPATAFYDADGKRTFVRRGGYGSEAELESDIERHAVGKR